MTDSPSRETHSCLYVCVCVCVCVFFIKSLLYNMFHYKEAILHARYCFMSCYRKRTIYMFGYLFILFSAYFAPILFPYLRSKLARYHRSSYKLSKFIAFKNIWNHFVFLFTKSQLDRGQTPPAFIILFLRVSLSVRNFSHSHITWSVACGPIILGRL
jgi:hypothetical protein